MKKFKVLLTQEQLKLIMRALDYYACHKEAETRVSITYMNHLTECRTSLNLMNKMDTLAEEVEDN